MIASKEDKQLNSYTSNPPSKSSADCSSSVFPDVSWSVDNGDNTSELSKDKEAFVGASDGLLAPPKSISCRRSLCCVWASVFTDDVSIGCAAVGETSSNSKESKENQT